LKRREILLDGREKGKSGVSNLSEEGVTRPWGRNVELLSRGPLYQERKGLRKGEGPTIRIAGVNPEEGFDPKASFSVGRNGPPWGGWGGKGVWKKEIYAELVREGFPCREDKGSMQA